MSSQRVREAYKARAMIHVSNGKFGLVHDCSGGGESRRGTSYPLRCRFAYSPGFRSGLCLADPSGRTGYIQFFANHFYTLVKCNLSLISDFTRL